MRFIYLVQTEGATPDCFKEIEDRSARSKTIDFLKLTFRDEYEGAIFLPNSTWTEGRNRLIQEARHRASYTYYVLCDDDLEILDGSWESFELSLTKYQPALGTPCYPSRLAKVEHLDAHSIYSHDAIVNAVHRDLIDDEIIFPYFGGYDRESWWISQFFVIHMAGIIYGDHVMCSNSLSISNGKHRAYPRIRTPDDWYKYEEYLFENVFEDKLFAKSRFHRHFGEQPPVRPMPHRRTSYRLTKSERALLKQSWRSLMP